MWAGTEQQTKSWWLIASIVTASAALPSAIANAGDIALSLVNPKGRIDIPASSITRVEARATFAFRVKETGKVFEYPNPHVEVCFTEHIRRQICQLTHKIVGQPLDIVIGCETVIKPVVREPLCSRPCFDISANDIAEATALARRIRSGSNRACAPSS